MRNRDLDKQQRIKEAMVHLILSEGMSGASVAKIARQAGVSPATIYVYYESKEAMLGEVFEECSHLSARYMLGRTRPDMSAAALIEALVQGYYAFSREHEAVFSFVEQCSICPTLSRALSEQELACDILERIHVCQRRGEIRPWSDLGIMALLFGSVGFLAKNRGGQREEEEAHLAEVTRMLKQLLLA